LALHVVCVSRAASAVGWPHPARAPPGHSRRRHLPPPPPRSAASLASRAVVSTWAVVSI